VGEQLLELNKRMDKQDQLLLEIRDKIVAHIAEESTMKPALEDLVALWKGSKIISAILAALCAAGAVVWGVFVWAKDHIK
jgi:hypothetical protein